MESNFEWITANGDIGIRFFHSIDDGGYSNPPALQRHKLSDIPDRKSVV